ncbi:aminotransferase class I/II-fold pyridoxal phosphate-dependent enzyme [Aeromicrobium camelliae]|uniref:cysteine-S-conjugate beta-lyase n=1 Tax=Aeromicrobium camelliae TaxID=1538144 RepID=A0A3N6YGT5_9ACTN|nr:aminotransferase class I/II-fold pyridoxal phosphate-dependent enzyme [Aeromicrobium camelliae]RQN08984.1 aminotransferase class I/II-fold pyridoxal phosphate-dependent enzyme [Aeromicrobium camelliae]
MRPLREMTEEQLRQRTSLKWSEYPSDVLPMWVAEMDVAPPEPVRRAVTALLERGDVGYPQSGHYLRAFADFASARWGWAPSAETGLEVADVMTGLRTAIELSTEPGAPLVLNPPVYPPFFDVIEWTGRRLETAPLGPDGRLDLDRLDTVLRRVGPGAAYLLCSPHNPTGAVHTRAELEAVARIAAERGARVLVDEIHALLVPAGFVPFLSVAGSERSYVATSASKGFNLAGVKAGLLFAGPEAADELATLPPLAGHGASQFGLAAHVAAVSEGREWLNALIGDLEENRAILRGLLSTHLPDVRWTQGPGGYLAWLEFPAALGDDPAARILERGRVALNSGLPFGEGGRRHARLNYATTPELLEAGITRIATAVR